MTDIYHGFFLSMTFTVKTTISTWTKKLEDCQHMMQLEPKNKS